ncbi:MAG: sugar ABC transporter permease [Caldilineaceae bacterium]
MQRVSKKVAPFAYLSPTLLLMAVLSLLPIGMVLSYSLMDNVIMNKNPVFVGINNYIELLTDDVFQQAIGNTLYFTAMSVIFHLILGLSFAMLLNTSLLGATTKAIFRVVYVLPWVFTATIIAILWRLMLNPNGVINYLIISAGFADRPIEWLSSNWRCTRSRSSTFGRIPLLHGEPAGEPSRAFPMNSTKPAPSTGPTDANSSASSPCHQLKPIIVSLAMLDFIWTMHQFTLIWMTTGGGPIHVTEMLSTFTYKAAFSSYEFALASASAFIILALALPVVALFYVRQQRQR